MVNLLAATAFFLAIHLLVSGTRVRDALTGAVGEGPYMGAFALASLGGLAWLILAFGGARGGPQLWDVTPATRIVQVLVTLAAFLLIVPGITTRNPTSVRQETAVQRADVVKGMLRITRHPFLWGVALWAAGHLMVNGDAASVVLFGSFLVLSIAGTFSIDAKRRRKLGADWDQFAAQTSNFPFGAVASGRQPLKLGEIGAWRIGLALAVWAAVAWAHPWLFGVRALP